MKRVQDVIVYCCSICGEVGTKESIALHESKCKEKYELQEEIRRNYKKNVKERIETAKGISTKNKAVLLLVSNGYDEEALLICKDLVRHLWDCGTSSGWQDVYREMIRAAKQEISNHLHDNDEMEEERYNCQFRDGTSCDHPDNLMMGCGKDCPFPH